jgi:uncharacterized protein (DUF1499 family)
MSFTHFRLRALIAAALAVVLCTGAVRSANMLPSCPDSPNCVSSRAVRPSQQVAPFAFTGPAEAAQGRLLRIIEQDRGATVVDARQGWIAVEFRSRVFGFIDDLRFELDPATGVFHVQSASRLGYWDLGVNRRRVEALRAKFNAGEPASVGQGR